MSLVQFGTLPSQPNLVYPNIEITLNEAYLQIGLLYLFPCFCAEHTAPGPHGEGLHGSGSGTHLWFKQTSPDGQSGSLTHSGAHPVIVSGLGIIPGTQLQMALPSPLTVQMVLGPQGEG